MFVIRPTTLKHLVLMDQVAEEKAAKYGAEFIQEINSFCSANNWPHDCIAQFSSTPPVTSKV